MRIDILTLFPGMFGGFLSESIIKRAREKGKADIRLRNIRDYAAGRHRKADDRPFGGGPGMVLQVEPIYNALKKIIGAKRSMVHGSTSSPRLEPSRAKSSGGRQSTVILMSPQGKKFDQKAARRFVKLKHLIIICGHYEGVDERVGKFLADEEISIGDYILTCGEIPAMVVTDAVVRLIPGVLGDKNSTVSETFENNILEYPQWTRPAFFRGIKAPNVLLSGDHEKIAAWRVKESLKRTKIRRPDLLRKRK